MKKVCYDNNFFKDLKKYDHLYKNINILIESDVIIDKNDINRIMINGWSSNNNYYFYIKNIDNNVIKNFLILEDIIKGIYIDKNNLNFNIDAYNILKDYCNAANLIIMEV